MTQELETSADWLIFGYPSGSLRYGCESEAHCTRQSRKQELSNFIEKILKEEISRSESKHLRGKT
jgi:hypothetical protein